MQILSSTSLPWVIWPSAAHCAVAVPTGMTTGPGTCPHPTTHFMLVRYPVARPGRRGVWCAFLCAGHAQSVPLAEPLDRVATAELADRRDQHALAMAGRPYRRPEPLQLSAADAGAR